MSKENFLQGVDELMSRNSTERNEAREIRTRTVLVCPDNDPESHMILVLAEKMGMAIVRSAQRHGAKLDIEPQIDERVLATQKTNAWIVEIPGPEVEKRLRAAGLEVQIIDHHVYESLDRLMDEKTGHRHKSSLEQFLAAAKITDKELHEWGFDPKTVRGLGIFDDRFVQGLRDEKYTQAEIAAVIDLGTAFSKQGNPHFAEIAEAAEKDWENREERNGFIIIRSNFSRDVRGAIGHRAIREGLDTVPLVVSSCGGKMMFVHQIDAELVKRLQAEIPAPSFVFGAGRCWGYDNSKGDKPIIMLEQVLKVLLPEKST